VPITDQEIIRRAADAGIATATKAGVPTERQLLNFARAHTSTTATRLADMTQAEKSALAAALDRRAVGELPSVTAAKRGASLEQRLTRAEARNIELSAANQGLISDLAQEAQQRTAATVAVADINLAPERFQYKLGVGPTGATRQFDQVAAWNPDLGRGVSLWVDPADGKTYVINGHNRVALARRFGVDEIAAPYYIQTATAAEARLVGALQNIAEGRGTPIDAAKLFRDADMSLDVLTRNGLALTESNVRKGIALANLNDTIFAAVVQQQIPIERAVIIGQKISDHDLQMQLIQKIDQQIVRGRNVTNDMIAEVADALVSGPTQVTTQATLFGVEAVTESLAWKKADFYVYVRGRLGKEKRLFGLAAANAEALQRAGQIDREMAAGISSQADQLLQLFDTFKNQTGPISDIGNQAAQALHATPGEALKVKGAYYDQLVEALPAALQERFGAIRPPAGGAGYAGPPGAAPGLFDSSLGIVSHPLDPIDVGRRAGTAISRTLREWWDDIAQLGPDPLSPLSAAQAQTLRDIGENVITPELIKAKAVTNDIATQLRNFALGDYAHRRNYVSWLTWVYPYITWYDFTYKNWAIRVLKNPALVSNYARYRAMLAEINTARYREQTGDPTAEIPPWWEQQLRISAGGHDLYFDLEATLNPLNNLLSEPFEPRERTRAPGGELMNQLNNWGPTMWAPIIWAYAARLWQDGYQEAAAQWVSYLTPLSRVIRSVTALAREHIPGAEQFIPPGGMAPEQIPNLWGGTALPPTVEGGDIWEKRRAAYFLRQLWLDGKLSTAEYQKTAAEQAGPFWDQAVQMQATARALPQLTSFFLGTGFKARTPQDIDIQKMWDDWFALSDQYDSLSWEAWNRQAKQFDQKYPGFQEMRMARTFDPLRRLEDYSWMVIDRLPPGTERYDSLAQVGLGDLYDKFVKSEPNRADQRSTWADTWSAAELATWRTGIDALAGQYDVPTPEQAARFEAARMIHTARNRHAAEIVQMMGYPLTYEQLRVLEDGYYQPGVDKKAYLAANPALAVYWDAKRAIDEQGVPHPGAEEIYGIPLTWEFPGGAMTPSQARPGPWSGPGGWLASGGQSKAITREFYTSAANKELLRLFGDDILDLMGYYGSLDETERRAYRQQHPAEYARMAEAWDYQDHQVGAAPVGAPTGAVSPPPVVVPSPGYTSGNAEYARKRAEATTLFGADILYWADTYSALPKTGGYRGAQGSFAKEHPAEYARLKQYWDFIYGRAPATTTGGYSGGVSAGRAYPPSGYTGGGRAYPSGGRAYPSGGRAYPSGGRAYPSGGRAYPSGGAVGALTAPPTGTGSWLPAATPGVTLPAEQRLWLAWSAEQFTALFDTMQTADPAFSTLIGALFDVYVIHSARAWFAMTPEERETWQVQNPEAWEMLQKFLDWFQEQTAALPASRMLQSIPPGAPTPPPLPPRQYAPLTAPNSVVQ